jgi:hypothetical protein
MCTHKPAACAPIDYQWHAFSSPLTCCAACVAACAADVANLVLDGADGIVLGSETFRGKFPVASVETVMAICRQAEKCFDSFAYYNSVMDYAGYHSLNPDISKVRHDTCAGQLAGHAWPLRSTLLQRQALVAAARGSVQQQCPCSVARDGCLSLYT